MKIQVTWPHINEGLRGDCMGCPVALALRAQTQWYADVAAGEISLWDGRECVLYFPTTLQVQNFILDFDGALKVMPFSFDLPTFIL